MCVCVVPRGSTDFSNNDLYNRDQPLLCRPLDPDYFNRSNETNETSNEKNEREPNLAILKAAFAILGTM